MIGDVSFYVFFSENLKLKFKDLYLLYKRWHDNKDRKAIEWKHLLVDL